jgi:hypothetical protein
MSNSKLRKHVEKISFLGHPSTLQWKPIILTDSKAKYLKSINEHSFPESQIKWQYKGGMKTKQQLDWLTHNLDNLLKEYGKISLYIWTGTCDLTYKEKNLVFVKQEDPVDTLKDYYQSIKKLVEKKENVKLTFLHVPYYSIEIWNRLKGHKTPDIFKEDDRKLNVYVKSVNAVLNSLNQELGTYSPNLNQDILRSRKQKNRPPRYSFKFSLFLDGIHPKRILAESWLKSISKKVYKDCAC